MCLHGVQRENFTVVHKSLFNVQLHNNLATQNQFPTTAECLLKLKGEHEGEKKGCLTLNGEVQLFVL
jgi:hypothetical protein